MTYVIRKWSYLGFFTSTLSKMKSLQSGERCTYSIHSVSSRRAVILAMVASCVGPTNGDFPVSLQWGRRGKRFWRTHKKYKQTTKQQQKNICWLKQWKQLIHNELTWGKQWLPHSRYQQLLSVAASWQLLVPWTLCFQLSHELQDGCQFQCTSLSQSHWFSGHCDQLSKECCPAKEGGGEERTGGKVEGLKSEPN